MAGGFLLLVVMLGGLATAWVGFAGMMGRLPPNNYAGIRTGFTRASKENWYNTHRAAGPVFLLGSVLVFAVALAFMPFAFAGKISSTLAVIVAAAAGGLEVGVALAGFFAGTSYAAAAAVSEAERKKAGGEG